MSKLIVAKPPKSDPHDISAILIRVPPADKAKFEAAARSERRSLSNWIEVACLRALNPEAK